MKSLAGQSWSGILYLTAIIDNTIIIIIRRRIIRIRICSFMCQGTWVKGERLKGLHCIVWGIDRYQNQTVVYNWPSHIDQSDLLKGRAHAHDASSLISDKLGKACVLFLYAHVGCVSTFLQLKAFWDYSRWRQINWSVFFLLCVWYPEQAQKSHQALRFHRIFFSNLPLPPNFLERWKK